MYFVRTFKIYQYYYLSVRNYMQFIAKILAKGSSSVICHSLLPQFPVF